ncbi:hypothetical protein U1437_20645, partial [Aeromonas caviae]|uniref:hypothetical protein n=1 Tax=Aeromonas caviae TaxID=648 RepID=UPI0030148103
AVLFGDKIRSQSKPFLYLFQLVAAKDPVHEGLYASRLRTLFKDRTTDKQGGSRRVIAASGMSPSA